MKSIYTEIPIIIIVEYLLYIAIFLLYDQIKNIIELFIYINVIYFVVTKVYCYQEQLSYKMLNVLWNICMYLCKSFLKHAVYLFSMTNHRWIHGLVAFIFQINNFINSFDYFKSIHLQWER